MRPSVCCTYLFAPLRYGLLYDLVTHLLFCSFCVSCPRNSDGLDCPAGPTSTFVSFLSCLRCSFFAPSLGTVTSRSLLHLRRSFSSNPLTHCKVQRVCELTIPTSGMYPVPQTSGLITLLQRFLIILNAITLCLALPVPVPNLQDGTSEVISSSSGNISVFDPVTDQPIAQGAATDGAGSGFDIPAVLWIVAGFVIGAPLCVAGVKGGRLTSGVGVGLALALACTLDRSEQLVNGRKANQVLLRSLGVHNQHRELYWCTGLPHLSSRLTLIWRWYRRWFPHNRLCNRVLGIRRCRRAVYRHACRPFTRGSTSPFLLHQLGRCRSVRLVGQCSSCDERENRRRTSFRPSLIRHRKAYVLRIDLRKLFCRDIPHRTWGRSFPQ